ncbi:hypothetical protein GUITHDRAFT_120677 [Guillardia theta CCMP2712]|uniref:Uncharacterized protein n=1 Tax=Guillardia theta (strain CCMP2712) TaxID=905079 RepID=L1IAA0_GUITC|nr:hypothetical protein GUITHDRAFT_120677 [Guillardia theta CCMP2712]EKX33158.1 hypothetical protein GUITHDRAFT_120677 [Guillardia theta CCMP2712]|mmetsp:Transcript_17808/g.58585  ORF Transcript_17808/g.58585 Transcript_17808/m.58585 type:complete len:93 (+) Transcript_17808:205-483(+)|eukprot:XP_005820138.1 hypothetical protein GUITHDRAFT_120677 [Guillardia theta CCMP2712]
MFAILVRAFAHGEMLYALPSGTERVVTGEEGKSAVNSALAAAAGGGALGQSDLSLAKKLAVSPELLHKEKLKAKEGFCETALWNCTDLYGSN